MVLQHVFWPLFKQNAILRDLNWSTGNIFSRVACFKKSLVSLFSLMGKAYVSAVFACVKHASRHSVMANDQTFLLRCVIGFDYIF